MCTLDRSCCFQPHQSVYCGHAEKELAQRRGSIYFETEIDPAEVLSQLPFCHAGSLSMKWPRHSRPNSVLALLLYRANLTTSKEFRITRRATLGLTQATMFFMGLLLLAARSSTSHSSA